MKRARRRKLARRDTEKPADSAVSDPTLIPGSGAGSVAGWRSKGRPWGTGAAHYLGVDGAPICSKVMLGDGVTPRLAPFKSTFVELRPTDRKCTYCRRELRRAAVGGAS